ncbi:MAG: amino acid permease, partial [Mycobacteriales bacterium]
IQLTSRVNMVLVAIKLFIVLFIVLAGLAYINVDNYSPFLPPSAPSAPEIGLGAPLLQTVIGQPTSFGILGVVVGASIVFFDYIGFDVVATTAEESRNPQRDLPIGILGSLAACTVLYVAITLVLTGMVKYTDVNEYAAIATAFERVGNGGFATIISIGAVAGLTSVVMTLVIGATRVVFAMSRDRLLPARLSRTSPRTGTPVMLTLIVGAMTAFIAALSPVGNMDELVNIGALAAFTLVSACVPLLRRQRPDLHRPFRVPASPVLPLVSAVVCFTLMLSLSIETWLRFAAWTALGLVVYAGYGRRRSRVRARG